MSTTEIKEQLHAVIDSGDEKLLKMIYALAKEYMDDSDGYVLSQEELRLLEEDEAAYERGEGKNYTWEEVKKMIKEGKGFTE